VRHQVDLIARINASKPIDTGLGRRGGGVANAVSVHIELTVAVADAEGVRLTDTIVHVVADSIGVEVCSARPATDANGIELGAIAVAISSGNVGASAIQNGTRAATYSAGIHIGT